LDDIAFPTFQNFQLNQYGSNGIPILTARGCPFLCAFCQQSALLGKKWRGRSAKNVVDEIEYWTKNGVTEFNVMDDLFTFDKSRIHDIEKELKDRKVVGIRMNLIGGVRVKGTDEPLLLSLRNIGVEYLSFGIESGSDKVLKFIKKGMKIKDAHYAVDLATKLGFKVRLFFIIGFPFETLEDVEKSFEFALKYDIYDARFFNLIPYEDTRLMDWLRENDVSFQYQYDEYMNDFREFQSKPVFEINQQDAMTIEEKKYALQRSKEVIAEIQKKRII
jgi:radical SAM superfamily enzyme YgiQ (UPF0313 family)